MNRDAIGAGAEIPGALAVFITLVYLAARIKQANGLARFSTSKDIMNQFNAINHVIATDSSVRSLLLNQGDLSEDQREQIYYFAVMFCNIWISVQTAYDNRQIGDGFYAAGARDVQVEIARWPNFRWAVEQWLSNHPEFKHYEIFRPLR